MRIRLVIRTLSELCVTAGTLILLFVVYLLYWTSVRADQAIGGEIDHLQDRWAAGPVAAADRPAPRPRAYESGRSFAIMYVPRFGADWAKPVLQGTGTATLRKGL